MEAQELWRKEYLRYQTISSVTHEFASRESYSMDNGMAYGLKLLAPLSPLLSLELSGKYFALNFTDIQTLSDTTNGGNTSWSYSNRTTHSEFDPYALGGRLIFHSSGADWNLPWGEGGSPWGRVLHPSFSVGGLAWTDHWQSSGESKFRQADLAGSLRLPLASWLAADARAAWSGDFKGTKNNYFFMQALPGMRSAFGYEWGLGLRLAPRFSAWTADYLKNSNPEGRLGIPSLSYEYSNFIADEGPISVTQHLELDIPTRPWLSFFADWTRLSPTQKLADLEKPYYNNLMVNQDLFSFGTRLHLGAWRPSPKISPEEKAALREAALEKKAEALQGRIWPRNPDGPAAFLFTVSHASAPDLSSDHGGGAYSGSFYSGSFRYNDHEALENAWLLKLRVTMPLSTWFSLGALAGLDQFSGKVEGSYNQTEDWTSPVLHYSYADGYNEPYSYGNVSLGMFMRFHTSGLQWNRPWGEGGSPWGRVLCPSFEISNQNSVYSATQGMNMALPLASWLCLNLGHSFREGRLITYDDHFVRGVYGTSWGYSNEQSQEFRAGLRAGLPLKAWFGPADYSNNASADGRVGIPVLNCQVRKVTDSSTPYKITQVLGVGIPVRPWMTLNGAWEHTYTDYEPNDAAGNTVYFSELDFYSLGLRFSLSAFKPKISVENTEPLHQNLLPSDDPQGGNP